ncbi:uncharacterized protein LOC108458612 [Gossypium arboreum]|uniref:uncharacterized protein LOC108458612 n=1 Tax=Gossypium arboreum TaxID=29729 RepID=UPI000819085B|nr:uncharacterized protein LOC108458612 [Gossypium arboreum]
METKLDHNRMERVRKHCGFHNGLDVSASGSRGELNEYPTGKKRFKFESWWILEPSCENVIKKWWTEKSREALEKLEYLRVNLQRWEKMIKGEYDKRSKALRKRLAELEGMNRDDDNLAEMINVKLELNWEMEKEESYWEQRARANWLRQ